MMASFPEGGVEAMPGQLMQVAMPAAASRQKRIAWPCCALAMLLLRALAGLQGKVQWGQWGAMGQLSPHANASGHQPCLLQVSASQLSDP